VKIGCTPALSSRLPGRAWLVLAASLFAAALAGYLADCAAHPGGLLCWYDLRVYYDAGLIARRMPSVLYTFRPAPGHTFTYTPFAAVVFAGCSLLPWTLLRWLMTAASLAAVPVIGWLTLGAAGQRGRARAAAALVVGAVALWTEPVSRGLYFGQIEPLLLLAVAGDLTSSDQRRGKGLGIGIAAGIKLVPLLFIPYLLLAGRIRQAAVAAAAFAATIVIGFIVLPGPSASFWLTGYFARPGRAGGVASLDNQSLLGLLARLAGGNAGAQPAWLPSAIVLALAGLAGGALLSRAGRPAAGWVLVGITSVLVSPISWDHHWIWIVPLLALLAAMAMTARGLVRLCYLAAAAGTAAVFGAWPSSVTGPHAFVPDRGLLGWFTSASGSHQATALHGWQLLTWNLYVISGLAIYLIMLASARRARRLRPVTVTVAAALPSLTVPG